MSLEVDCRDSGYLFPVDKQEEKIRADPRPPHAPSFNPPLVPDKDNERISRLRRSNLLLLLALILAVAMAVVAAAVGGSVAVERQHEIERYVLLAIAGNREL